eukprot:Colp12_sorted_trinity150504_noHs@17928
MASVEVASPEILAILNQIQLVRSFINECNLARMKAKAANRDLANDSILNNDLTSAKLLLEELLALKGSVEDANIAMNLDTALKNDSPLMHSLQEQFERLQTLEQIDNQYAHELSRNAFAPPPAVPEGLLIPRIDNYADADKARDYVRGKGKEPEIEHKEFGNSVYVLEGHTMEPFRAVQDALPLGRTSGDEGTSHSLQRELDEEKQLLQINEGAPNIVENDEEPTHRLPCTPREGLDVPDDLSEPVVCATHVHYYWLNSIVSATVVQL